jgi:hypothetical protein
MMDAITREFFEMKFEMAFVKKRQNEFQDLFSSIMELGYPGDFTRIRPWGKIGDRKNDGYLKSKRTLFQVYAPNEPKAAETVRKIDDDFNGALAYWKEDISAWIFVHNARDGLGPEVFKKLRELAAAHPHITVADWGYSELRQEVFRLGEHDLARLFGQAASQKGLVNLGLADLAPVLDQLALLSPIEDPDLRPVPADKLQRNLLSSHVAELLRAGMSRNSLVAKYFRTQPIKQDGIAQGFREKYLQLRKAGLSPDEIFVELQRFAGGEQVPTAARQSAVLAVLAYFFETCDIFERPSAEGGRP